MYILWFSSLDDLFPGCPESSLRLTISVIVETKNGQESPVNKVESGNSSYFLWQERKTEEREEKEELI